jgi:uncharacterized repeat protein (TIGR01451 family)
MKKGILICGLSLLFFAGTIAVSRQRDSAAAGVIVSSAASAETLADVHAFGKMPIYFIPNRGQMEGSVDFYIQGNDKTVFFTPDGVTFALSYGPKPIEKPTDTSRSGGQNSSIKRDAGSRPARFEKARNKEIKRWVVKMDFVGERKDIKPEGLDSTGAVISYFKGKPEDWHAGLSAYSKIIYRNLWPGIDLVYKGDIDKLKYEFIVHPGANPKAIRMALQGAEKAIIDDAGRLEITTPAGSFVDEAPLAYQETEGKRIDLKMAYRLEERTDPDNHIEGRIGKPEMKSYVYGFEVGAYDNTRTLVLDPATLIYCGYIGGNTLDYGRGIAVDGSGNVYITGNTSSQQPTFPLTIGPDLTFNGGSCDAFVAKIKSDGSGLVYCGYIGGSNEDYGCGIAVDGSGNAYVTGYTSSKQATFPVIVGPDLTFNGSNTYYDYDAFVAKINPAGTALVYCGYIGGIDYDYGNGIAVDGSGNAYVTGTTNSDQATFPVTVGPDLTYNDALIRTGNYGDAFVAKINPAGTALVYCGYIGGSYNDKGEGIAIDGLGNAYVTGASAGGLPVTVGPNLKSDGGYDVFVAKIKSDGSGLVYCGYIAGSDDDWGKGIALDASGNAYIAGLTYSDQATFPVAVGPDLTFNNDRSVPLKCDAFVAKVKADGTGLVYCGYIGGSNYEEARGIAVDGSGNAYVVGFTNSDQATFPVIDGPDLTFNDDPWAWGTPGRFYGDAFVAKINSTGTALVYCGYIGGRADDCGSAIAVDGSGNAYIAGFTQSDQATFPVIVGPDLTFNSPYQDYDAFVAKISKIANIAITKSADNLAPKRGLEFNFTVTARNGGPDEATGLRVTDLLPAGISFVSAAPSQGSYSSSSGLWTVGSLANGATATLIIKVTATNAGTITNTAVVSALNENDPVLSDNSASVEIEVKRIQPPLFVMGQRIVNRSLSQIEYINKLTWQANPDNEGFGVNGYKIYRINGESSAFLAEVAVNVFAYLDRKAQRTQEYQFGISTVNSLGFESDLVYVTIR